jgi:predicted nucleic acid-binding Zn ribbon protein
MLDRTHSSRKEPAPLGDVLSQLFALRGYGRVRGDRQLHDVWRQIAGEQIAGQTRVAGVKNGVLQVGVASSALLSELAAFHKFSLLERLQREHAQLKIKDIKFKLRGDIGST